MVAQSCDDLLALESGDLRACSSPKPAIHTMPSQGMFRVLGDIRKDADTEIVPARSPPRKIVVANHLPLRSEKGPDGKWTFSWDADSILLQLKDAISDGFDVYYVGSLKVDIDLSDQDDVARLLLDEFKCVPTFLASDLVEKYYHGFCKQQLWQVFHYMLPLSSAHGDRFDQSLWRAYVSANKAFADKVTEVLSPDDDYVWIHDYHLMVLPTFLRKRFHRVRLGFFLHSPFPSSEIYRTLPVREEILRGLLNSDLIGFHTFDYARHFLSSCSRILGLDYECRRGYLGLEYYGRVVNVKILPVGIHMGQLESVLDMPETSAKVKEIREQYEGKTLIVGADDMDIFKGISLKLLAMGMLLESHPELRGKVVLVQIANPARSSGKDVKEARTETISTAERVNKKYGYPGYQPIVVIDHPIPLYEKIAYYVVAECCALNAVRDGMNLFPYKYVVCRQGTPLLDKALGVDPEVPRKSMLIVSEFVGCSPSLSGAIRVNPWNIEAVADAMHQVFYQSDQEKHLRHVKHYRYVSSHDVSYWARSFDQNLIRVCKDVFHKRCWGMGFGLGFRVVSLDPSFKKLNLDTVMSDYRKASKRAIFLDYDGTMIPPASVSRIPSDHILSILVSLCNDPKNTVFIVSGRGRDNLCEWFSSCEMLGIAAEHGHFIRWNKGSKWESPHSVTNFSWKKVVEPIMRSYVDSTDGSSIEVKESALVWHYRDAAPEFGSSQAKELLDHLEDVLSNEPVVVKRGQCIVEVKPQGVSKGHAVDHILSSMLRRGSLPDFVLCVGDDRSDEDMFESISNAASGPSFPSDAEVYACTVGQKPSKAKYFVDDSNEVVRMLLGFATLSIQKNQHQHQHQQKQQQQPQQQQWSVFEG